LRKGWELVGDDPARCFLFGLREPRQGARGDDLVGCGADTQVEVWRRPGALDGAVLVDVRVAEPPRDGCLGRVDDLLDDATSRRGS